MDYGRRFRHELGLDRKLETPFSKPLADAVLLFDALRIGYALIGGVAAMYYGRPRITEDVDSVAIPGHEAVLAANAEAMKSFGFDPSSTWKLCHQSGVEIHIWKDEFADGIVHRAATARLGEIVVRIAEVHDLLATNCGQGASRMTTTSRRFCGTTRFERTCSRRESRPSSSAISSR